MSFRQDPPRLRNQYDDDRVLRSLLRRMLPPATLREIEPELRRMGRLAGGPLYRMQLADRLNEPTLTQWDGWGNRVDRIDLTPLWNRAETIAAKHGVVATAYEGKHGEHSRIHQFALAYLFTPSTDLYSCPLAMTDGAARTLLQIAPPEVVERAVPRLTSRTPSRFWTSGQWMTEATGGSDVSRTETVARQEDGQWRLYGLKWFTSAATSQVALALARPEGAPAGSRGLTLFYLETRDEAGRLQGIRVRRLKDKLGTRKLPTAELELDGVVGIPIGAMGEGIRSIVPLLNLTRTWNAVSACAFMRRGIALARDFARRRSAFGRPLSENPLHLDTLSGLQAELEGAMHLTFRLVELIGRGEAAVASEQEQRLIRLLTPLAKLLTARQAVAVCSECLEAHGGAGYIEDTGLPQLLRDAQVLTIWEGTTNVLAMDLLRAIGDVGAQPLIAEIGRCSRMVRSERLAECARVAEDWASRAEAWRERTVLDGGDGVTAGARRYAMMMGRALELALLCAHAQWALETGNDLLPAIAARRFASSAPRLCAADPGESAALALDGLPPSLPPSP